MNRICSMLFYCCCCSLFRHNFFPTSDHCLLLHLLSLRGSNDVNLPDKARMSATAAVPGSGSLYKYGTLSLLYFVQVSKVVITVDGKGRDALCLSRILLIMDYILNFLRGRRTVSRPGVCPCYCARLAPPSPPSAP